MIVTDRRVAMAITSVLVALAGCGGGDERPAATGDIGRARLAANGPAEGLQQGSVPPRAGVVEGEPPRDSAPPAAVGGPRRSCSGGGLDPTGENLAEVARATLCLLNIEREARGLSPLRSNGRLARAALDHSRDMVRRSYFSHQSRSGASFVDRIRRRGYFEGQRRWLVGENLGWGKGARSTPRAMVDAWMNSPGHRANILQRRFRDVGIGIVLGAPQGSKPPPAGTYNTAFGVRSR